MNVELANVISDLRGVTGQLIVRAVVAGERDPRKLAELSHPRIQASREEIAKSLEGNWRQELIFVLQQEIEMYDTYKRRVSECDQQLQKHLIRLADTVPARAKEEVPQKKNGKQNKNNPHLHLADELERITGVDLTRIDGVDVMVAQTLVSEVGLDISRWKTEAHFASWLGLCPDNRIVNRPATAPRLGASTLLRSQTYLVAQYRRLRDKLGAPNRHPAPGCHPNRSLPVALLLNIVLPHGHPHLRLRAAHGYYAQGTGNSSPCVTLPIKKFLER
jgi:hypothetical protein